MSLDQIQNKGRSFFKWFTLHSGLLHSFCQKLWCPICKKCLLIKFNLSSSLWHVLFHVPKQTYFINNRYNTCKAWPIDKNSEQNSCTLKSRSFSATAPKGVFLQIWAAWPSSLPISQTVPCPSFPAEVQKVDHGLASNWQKKATTIKLTASGPSNKNLTRNPLSCGTHKRFWIAN